VHREMHFQVTFLSSENVGGHWRSVAVAPPNHVTPKSQTSGTPRDVTGCGPHGSRPPGAKRGSQLFNRVVVVPLLFSLLEIRPGARGSPCHRCVTDARHAVREKKEIQSNFEIHRAAPRRCVEIRDHPTFHVDVVGLVGPRFLKSFRVVMRVARDLSVISRLSLSCVVVPNQGGVVRPTPVGRCESKFSVIL
jgi:hypothetical protein